MRPDKAKVVDEVWDDDRIKRFLSKQPPDLPGDADFHVLLFAYQSMRAEDFGQFLKFFVADGRDVEAINGGGMSLKDYLARHTLAQPYIDLLSAAVR
ncbi:MAG: PA4642 family protein [Gammaproteobacteria bacterium]|nr:PA4642 family protein [Gammaproteobacteria bacterium]